MTWVKRIAGGLGLLVLLAILVGVAWEQWSRARAAAAFPPPGELVQVDGRSLHLLCTGEGSPTVILEAGLDLQGTRSWTSVQSAIGETTRVCSYDRAGIMWSEPGPGPRDAHRIADDLHALLEAAGESPPFVMVGHSLGGLFQRVYDERHPDEVEGFVFVDSSHPEQMERLPAAMMEGMEACTPNPLLIRAAARLGAMRFAGEEAMAAMAPGGSAATQALAPRGMPTLLDEADQLETIAAQAGAVQDLGTRPVVVLSAGKALEPPECAGIDDATMQEMSRLWSELQEEIAMLSSNSRRERIEESGHYVQLDAPEAVISAVRDVVSSVREGTPVPDGRSEDPEDGGGASGD